MCVASGRDVGLNTEIVNPDEKEQDKVPTSSPSTTVLGSSGRLNGITRIATRL
jgi:hypothetical protein